MQVHTIIRKCSVTEELKQEVPDAKEKEIQNAKNSEIYEVVRENQNLENQKAISYCWMYTQKDGESKNGKDRLVAHRFEEDLRWSAVKTDSPK